MRHRHAGQLRRGESERDLESLHRGRPRCRRWHHHGWMEFEHHHRLLDPDTESECNSYAITIANSYA